MKHPRKRFDGRLQNFFLLNELFLVLEDNRVEALMR